MKCTISVYCVPSNTFGYLMEIIYVRYTPHVRGFTQTRYGPVPYDPELVGKQIGPRVEYGINHPRK